MRAWVLSPRAVSVHFKPTCRNGLFARNSVEVQLKPEQVRWKLDRLWNDWVPSHLDIEIDGKVRSFGPCLMCCPVKGKKPVGYAECMEWLAKELGATPPKAR